MKKLLLAAALVALVGCDDATVADTQADNATTQAAAPEEAIEVTAEELWATYDQNELAGDKAYKGKPLIVSGVLDAIESGFGDAPYLTLKAGDEYNFSLPQAHFDKDETDSLVTLSKGESVTLRCTGDGEVMGSPMLADCTIV